MQPDPLYQQVAEDARKGSVLATCAMRDMLHERGEAIPTLDDFVDYLLKVLRLFPDAYTRDNLGGRTGYDAEVAGRMLDKYPPARIVIVSHTAMTKLGLVRADRESPVLFYRKARGNKAHQEAYVKLKPGL